MKLFRPGDATVKTWLAARATRRCSSPSPNATWVPSVRCMSVMPAGLRAVIQAVVLDGLSAREAAQLLHVPVSSVKTRLYRAKAHLRAALAEGSS
jgi:DNA-directed RNA polymerase specialized sigma24 family protein